MKQDLLCDVLMCCAMLLLGFGLGMATEELKRDYFGVKSQPAEQVGFGFSIRLRVDDTPKP